MKLRHGISGRWQYTAYIWYSRILFTKINLIHTVNMRCKITMNTVPQESFKTHAGKLKMYEMQQYQIQGKLTPTQILLV